MPTYEYACRDCGEHLEVVQSFKDDPLTVCPACKGRLRKVFTAAGIVFKGGGWHVKDYARPPKSQKKETADSGGGAAKEKSGAASTSDDTTSSSTEKRPA